jgi:hypothetical protein
MTNRRGILLSAIVLLAACGGDGPTEPPPGGEAVALVVAPAALLFPAAGEQQQLKAYLVDADGTRTEVTAAFTSSNEAVAAVTAGGLATGGSSIGSARIVATSAGLTSVPVLALRATPVTGTLLVADSQVVGDPSPSDTLAEFGLGWREEVQLRGVAASPGQIILGTGGAPIGGRIVAVEPGTNGTSLVTYELIALPDLFQALRIQERIPLTTVPPASFNRASRQRAASSAVTRSGRVDLEFAAGPFECKAEVPPNVATVPFTTGDYTADIQTDLEMELDWDDVTGLRAAVIVGTLGANLTGKPRLTLAVEAKVECKWEWGAVYVPIGGPISRFFGWKIPLGLGLELSGKVTEDGVGVDFSSRPSVRIETGVRCAGVCAPVIEVSGQAPGSLTPVFPALGDAGEIKLGAAGFLYADMVVGWHFLRRLNIKAFEAKAGIKQEASLATRSAQAADPAYASTVSLTGFAEAGTSANVEQFWQLLRLSVPQLKKDTTFAPEAHSPRGTFTISPASVTPGDGTQLGEQATFTVALTEVAYLGAYAVEGIEIRWQKTDGTTVILEPGRPGCTDIEAAQDQVSFSCQADFLEEHEGPQTFYAFVKTRIFGVSLPVPLEIALDAKATVTVGGDTPNGVTLDVTKGYGPGTEAGVGSLSCSKNWDIFEAPVSPSLTDENSSTCSASGVDPSTGAVLSAQITGATSYTVVTSTGTTAGDVSSVRVAADLTGSVHGAALQDAQAGSRGRLEMCFTVAAGASVGWQISGTVQAGDGGETYVELSGSGVGRQEINGANGAFSLSGRLDEGGHCMELYYKMVLETSSDLLSLDQSLHSTATLTFLR